MERTATGIWLPKPVAMLKMRPRTKTVTLPNGERAKVIVEPTSLDGSTSVTHIERNEGIDAIVRPKPIKLKVRRIQ